MLSTLLHHVHVSTNYSIILLQFVTTDKVPFLLRWKHKYRLQGQICVHPFIACALRAVSRTTNHDTQVDPAVCNCVYIMVALTFIWNIWISASSFHKCGPPPPISPSVAHGVFWRFKIIEMFTSRPKKWQFNQLCSISRREVYDLSKFVQNHRKP